MAGNTKSFTRAAAVVIAAASLFYAAASEASCAGPESTAPFEISVTAAWKAEHVNDGDIAGCLLTAQTADGQKITAYTPYEFICALKPDEKISVAPSYACCDTGLQGDFVCGVKPRVPLNVVSQTPLTLAPATHDARAIADLMARGLSGKLREASAIAKLQEYLGDPAYSETVKKQLPQLEAAVDNGTLQDAYTKGLVASLLLAGEPDSPKRTGWRIMQFEGGIDYALTPVQKSIAQELLEKPDTARRFMPVLIDRLRRASEPDRIYLLSVAARSDQSKAHITGIRDALGGDIDLPDAAPDSRPAPADNVEAVRREAEQKALAEMIAARTALRAVYLPLLKKIACTGETGQVTIGSVYKTTLDCAATP
jgi:hypothetical protein